MSFGAELDEIRSRIDTVNEIPEGHTDETWVFSFDRDRTISSGTPAGPVPLEFLYKLKKYTDHKLVAHGNQRLVEEANIGGRGWMLDELDREVNIDTSVKHAQLKAREKFATLCMDVWPEADKYFLVDDIDLSHLQVRDNNIQFYYPAEFYLSFRKYIWWFNAHG